MKYVLTLLFLLISGTVSAQVITTTGGNIFNKPTVGVTLPTKQIASGLAYTANTIAASTSFSIISRKCGYARQALTTQQLVYWGGSVQVGTSFTGAEWPNDNNETLKAWIEYPLGAGDAIGTTTQVLFSGVGTATLNSNAMLISDATSVTIPNNTEYCIITYIAPNTGHVTYWGDGFQPVCFVQAARHTKKP